MRKTMTKEVTSTTIKLAQMVMENGAPVAKQLPDEVILGNVTIEKAQKEMSKKYDEAVTVFGVEANTVVYELPVEDFIKIATVKVAEEQTEEQA